MLIMRTSLLFTLRSKLIPNQGINRHLSLELDTLESILSIQAQGWGEQRTTRAYLSQCVDKPWLQQKIAEDLVWCVSVNWIQLLLCLLAISFKMMLFSQQTSNLFYINFTSLEKLTFCFLVFHSHNSFFYCTYLYVLFLVKVFIPIGE